MKTPNELVSKMMSEMPFIINGGVVPYLIELAEIVQTEAYNQAIDDSCKVIDEWNKYLKESNANCRYSPEQILKLKK